MRKKPQSNEQWPGNLAKQKAARKTSDRKPEGVETLSASISDINQAFALMDRDHSVSRQRRHERIKSLGMLQMVVEIIQPGGTSSPLVVHGHNISESGVGFVHGRYLYPGSHCVCWLVKHDTHAEPHKGQLRWCRHVSGVVHVSGVELESPIRVTDFLKAPAA